MWSLYDASLHVCVSITYLTKDYKIAASKISVEPTLLFTIKPFDAELGLKLIEIRFKLFSSIFIYLLCTKIALKVRTIMDRGNLIINRSRFQNHILQKHFR